MVCEAFGGGVFAYVSQLCNDMCEEFDVYLAYAVRPQTPEKYKDAINPKVHLIEVKNFGNGFGNVIVGIKAIRELQKIAKDIKPDIVHLHSSIAGGFGRIAFNEKNGYRLVYTPHGYAHILMGTPDSLKCRVYKWIEIILGKKKHITLTCCESEDEVAKGLTKRTAFVETGVNIEDLHRTIDPVPMEKENVFTVYAMGRICTQKQPALFNEIAKGCPNVRFVWIGTGELQHELTSPNIEITGWKPRHDAIAMGKGADIYILCSLGEAIAMSLIENMYMGKLCLVSNSMGNKSVIKNGVNGYVCETAKDYIAHIEKAKESFPQNLADRGRKDVLEHYNTERMKQDYIRFYKQAMLGEI